VNVLTADAVDSVESVCDTVNEDVDGRLC